MLARFAIALVTLLALASPARAIDFFVSTLADDGAGSLRSAVGAANTNPGPDAIFFLVTGTITLTTGALVVTDDLWIETNNPRTLVIDGNLNDRIFRIDSTALDVTLIGLTLTRGLTLGNGGAILNDGGNLTLSNMRITDNQAEDTGGAIYDSFHGDVGGNSVNFLTISNSEISVNRANKAAGIFHIGFELRIDNSTIYNNIAPDSVGGIHEQGGFATIRNSTIASNNANLVGGILSENSTITFESTLVAGNTDSTGTNDINRIGSGTVNATNSLFEEDITLAPAVINGTNTGNLIGVGPQLLLFGNNGGPTNSTRPGPASPAIGTGSNSQGYTTDQRGNGFPRDAGGAVDIGAVQAFLAPPPPSISIPVPAIGPAALALLALLVGAAGAAMRRRR